MVVNQTEKKSLKENLKLLKLKNSLYKELINRLNRSKVMNIFQGASKDDLYTSFHGPVMAKDFSIQN